MEKLINKRYGFLLVIDRDGSIGNRAAWKCKCACGGIKTVSSKNLIEGDTKSCGCLKRNKPSDLIGKISKDFWTTLQRSAKTRDIEFTLSREDAWNIFERQNGKCALSGDILILNGLNGNASIDRIDSSVGYNKNNIQWVTKRINIAKNKISNMEFIDLCRKVTNNTMS